MNKIPPEIRRTNRTFSVKKNDERLCQKDIARRITSKKTKKAMSCNMNQGNGRPITTGPYSFVIIVYPKYPKKLSVVIIPIILNIRAYTLVLLVINLCF